MQPKVSVVISYFRQSRFLLDAVRSAIAQTYSNVEVIVVDDCCPDARASELLEPCAGERLRVIRHKESLGLAARRNTGVHNAGGELIIALDAEDMLAPDYLEKMVPPLADQSLTAAYSRVQYFGAEDGGWLPNLAIPDSLFEGVPVTFLYRRRAFEDLGGYDFRAVAAPDRSFVISMLRAGYQFFRLDKPLYRKRKHHRPTKSPRDSAAETIGCALAVHADLYEQHLTEVVSQGAAAWSRDATRLHQTKCELHELEELSKSYAEYS